MPASAVKVEAVTTVDTQLRPPAAAAITPEPLNTLLVTVPLIIFSYNFLSYYALFEYPAPAVPSLAVPTPLTSAVTTPTLFTKFDIAVSLPPDTP